MQTKNPEFTFRPKKNRPHLQIESTPGSACTPCPELVWRLCVVEHVGAKWMVVCSNKAKFFCDDYCGKWKPSAMWSNNFCTKFLRKSSIRTLQFSLRKRRDDPAYEKHTLTEDEGIFFVAETVLTIESIHKHNYVHRYIKPDTLVLDRYGHLRLSDIGLCKPLDCSTPEEKDFSPMDNVCNSKVFGHSAAPNAHNKNNCSIGR